MDVVKPVKKEKDVAVRSQPVGARTLFDPPPTRQGGAAYQKRSLFCQYLSRFYLILFLLTGIRHVGASTMGPRPHYKTNTNEPQTFRGSSVFRYHVHS